eukprot:GHVP01009427.1.p1 GENE.GHVP01009427.1~~GHVP01009427.1.p1  ORF type:complete len:107 (+),score=1.15 GHVP01009427.1:138-458(+)
MIMSEMRSENLGRKTFSTPATCCQVLRDGFPFLIVVTRASKVSLVQWGWMIPLPIKYPNALIAYLTRFAFDLSWLRVQLYFKRVCLTALALVNTSSGDEPKIVTSS